MELEMVKTTIRSLAPSDRRKIALYILELEKEYVQKKYGPQIAEELDGASKAFQEAIEKLKNFLNKN